MKTIYTLIAIITSINFVNAQVVTYDIPIGQTIGLQQTTGDICSAPFNIEEAFQASAGNTWGFTWTSTNPGVATSVEITLGFTVTDGGGSFPTTLNGSASTNVADGAAKACENSTILTWSVDPANYNSGGTNTFLVDFSTANNVSQVDNLPFPNDPFFRITVDYSPCNQIDTSLSQNQNTLTSNASNLSYQWFNCETDNEIQGETGVSFTPSVSGDYGVAITDPNTGCSDTSSCATVIIASGIEELEQRSLNVYPNPVQNEIGIDLHEFGGLVTLTIHDVQGKLILSKKVTVKGGSPVILDLSELPHGFYQVTATSKYKTASAKFVKD